MKNVIIVDESAINNVITDPKIRRAIYSIYAVLGVVIGSIQVAFGIQGTEAQWLETTVGVYAYLALPVGALALVNAPSKASQESVSVEESEKIQDAPRRAKEVEEENYELV